MSDLALHWPDRVRPKLSFNLLGSISKGKPLPERGLEKREMSDTFRSDRRVLVSFPGREPLATTFAKVADDCIYTGMGLATAKHITWKHMKTKDFWLGRDSLPVPHFRAPD